MTAPKKPAPIPHDLRPEPVMRLHAQRTVATERVPWLPNRITSNDRKGKNLYTADQVKFWRTLALRATEDIAPIPAGTVARVVVFYRQPSGKGSGAVHDVGNLQPITKAIVDGMTGGVRGERKGLGPWPDDSTRYVIGQDEREILPRGPLRVVVQVWVGEVDSTPEP